MTWYAWAEYLDKYCKKFPAITIYHRFVFTPVDDIALGLRATSNLEVIAIQVASLQNADALVIEEVVLPNPLSPARQWYVYNTIRQRCLDESKKDLVARKPDIPEVKSEDCEGVSGKRNLRKI